MCAPHPTLLFGRIWGRSSVTNRHDLKDCAGWLWWALPGIRVDVPCMHISLVGGRRTRVFVLLGRRTRLLGPTCLVGSGLDPVGWTHPVYGVVRIHTDYYYYHVGPRQLAGVCSSLRSSFSSQLWSQTLPRYILPGTMCFLCLKAVN